VKKTHLLTTGLVGSAVAAVCCFTPLLVGVLGVLGLGGLTGYLDYVLVPALAGFLGLTFYSLSRKVRDAGSACCGKSMKGMEGSEDRSRNLI
jgi:mercuric ion transport protein